MPISSKNGLTILWKDAVLGGGRKSEAAGQPGLGHILDFLTPERGQQIVKTLSQSDDFFTLFLEQCRAGQLVIYNIKQKSNTFSATAP